MHGGKSQFLKSLQKKGPSTYLMHMFVAIDQSKVAVSLGELIKYWIV